MGFIDSSTPYGVRPPHPAPVLTPADVIELQEAADEVFVDHGVVEYAVDLVTATRDPGAHGLADIADHLAFGASPRASLGLVAAGRALARLRGRTYALPQDIFDVAPDILRHRLVLSYEALADAVEVEDLVNQVLSTVPAPRVAPSQDPAFDQRGVERSA